MVNRRACDAIAVCFLDAVRCAGWHMDCAAASCTRCNAELAAVDGGSARSGGRHLLFSGASQTETTTHAAIDQQTSLAGAYQREPHARKGAQSTRTPGSDCAFGSSYYQLPCEYS